MYIANDFIVFLHWHHIPTILSSVLRLNTIIMKGKTVYNFNPNISNYTSQYHLNVNSVQGEGTLLGKVKLRRSLMTKEEWVGHKKQQIQYPWKKIPNKDYSTYLGMPHVCQIVLVNVLIRNEVNERDFHLWFEYQVRCDFVHRVLGIISAVYAT